jgi:hypothetical protein
MKRLILGLVSFVAAASAAFASTGLDINGGLSWNGWSYRGNSLEAGVWAAASGTRSYEVYSTVFTFNNHAVTGSPVQVQYPGTPGGFAAGPYSPGSFANGNRILGIGFKMNGTARALGENFVQIAIQGENFRPASALGVGDGRVGISQWGRTGDISMWLAAQAGPSNVAVMTDNGVQQGGLGTYINFPGGNVGYDFCFRQFRQGDVGGSTQMFFDLTALQNIYGGVSPIGTIGDKFTISIYNTDEGWVDAGMVVFGMPDTDFVPICFGDGTGTVCPCSNNAPVGSEAGCLNSNGTAGRLTASGVASLSNDTLSLSGSGMINSFAIYIQGTQANASGIGSVLGDGKLCVTGSLMRLGTVLNAGGASSVPNASNPLPLSVRGGVTSPGKRTYQIYYRNPAEFCTTGTFNLTNAMIVSWTL